MMSMHIAATAIIHDHVILGKDVIIEDYCIIGVPIKDNPTAQTVIGDRAHLRSFTVIYAGNQIGHDFQTGNKANIREYNQIGNHVSIGTLSIIEHHVKIANHVRIHSQAFIPEYSILEEGAWIGPNVVLTNAKYPLSPDVKKNLQGPHIAAQAKIGANTTILPGVHIGAHSLVGAGSVVTQDIAAQQIVAGSPARLLRPIDY